MKVIALAAATLIAGLVGFSALGSHPRHDIERVARAMTRELETGLPRFVAFGINQTLGELGVPGLSRTCDASPAPPPIAFWLHPRSMSGLPAYKSANHGACVKREPSDGEATFGGKVRVS